MKLTYRFFGLITAVMLMTNAWAQTMTSEGAASSVQLETGSTFKYTDASGIEKTYVVTGENLISNPPISKDMFRGRRYQQTQVTDAFGRANYDFDFAIVPTESDTVWIYDLDPYFASYGYVSGYGYNILGGILNIADEGRTATITCWDGQLMGYKDAAFGASSDWADSVPLVLYLENDGDNIQIRTFFGIRDSEGWWSAFPPTKFEAVDIDSIYLFLDEVVEFYENLINDDLVGTEPGMYSEALVNDLIALEKEARTVLGKVEVGEASIIVYVQRLKAAMQEILDNPVSIVIGRSDTALNGYKLLDGATTNESGVVTYKSPLYTFSHNLTRIRFTVKETGSNGLNGGYPFFSLSSFEMFDAEGNEIELTAADITSNACHNTLNPGSPDGAGIDGLVDDDPATFFHSTWGVAVNEAHYLEVTLPEGEYSAFSFAMTARSTSHPHQFPAVLEITTIYDATADNERNALNNAINNAQAIVDAKASVGDGIFMYSEEVYNNLAAAVITAKKVSENPEATKDELVAALTTLNTATEAYVVTPPAADAVYAVKLNGTENYLTIGESTITIDTAIDALSFEDAGNGNYYIHDSKGKYLSNDGRLYWNLTASTETKDEWTISINAEGLYTFVGKNGGIGVDNTGAGAVCYGDKKGDAVALWTITETATEEIFDWAGEYTLTATVETEAGVDTEAYPATFDVAVKLYEDGKYRIEKFMNADVYTLNQGNQSVDIATDGKSATLALDAAWGMYILGGGYPDDYIIMCDKEGKSTSVSIELGANNVLTMDDFTVYAFNWDTYTYSKLATYSNVTLTKEVINSGQLETGDTFEYTNAEGVVKTYKIIGENLIKNPSFDNGTTGWTGGAGGALSNTEVNYNGGVDGGAYIRPTSSSGKGSNNSIGTAWDVEKGKTYVFSFFMKNQSNTAAENPAGDGYIKVSMSNTYRDETLVLQPLPHVDADLAWTQNTWVVTAEYTSLALCARWLGGAKCFDAFILAEVEEVTDTKYLPSINDFRLSIEEDITYDGLPHAVEITALKDIGNFAVKYIDSKGDETTSPPSEVGTYYVNIEVEGNDKYTATTLTSVASFTISVMDEVEWNTLLELYEQTDGANSWKHKWDINGGIAAAASFHGVTYKKGHIAELNLSNSNLVGELPVSVITLPYLEKLTLNNNKLTGKIDDIIAQTESTGNVSTINISSNNMRGNISTLVNCCPKLEYLYAERNHFSDVTPALPSNLKVSLSGQTLDDILVWDESITMSTATVSFPTILSYQHKQQGYINPQWSIYKSWDAGSWYVLMEVDLASGVPVVRAESLDGYDIYYGNSGDTLEITSTSVTASSSTAKMIYYFKQGDANHSGDVDILDLQSMINFIFKEFQDYAFNFTAANIQDKDSKVDVLDVIAFINQQMEESIDQAFLSRAKARLNTKTDNDAYIYWDNDCLILETTKDIAALDIILQGTYAPNWNDALDMTIVSSTQDNYQRAIVYSLSGKYLAQGKHVLLTAKEPCNIVSALIADRAAQKVSVDFKAPGTTLQESIDANNIQCRLSESWLQLIVNGTYEQLVWEVYNPDGTVLGKGYVPNKAEGIINLLPITDDRIMIVVVKDKDGIVLTNKITNNK